MQTSAKARIQLLCAAALFSTGGVAIKACEFRGFELAGLRSSIALVAFLALVPLARTWPSGRAWLVGVIYAATLSTFVVANKLTTSANAIFLQATAPLYVLILAPFLLGERWKLRDLWFFVAMAAGLACFFFDEAQPSATAPDPQLGNQIGLISGVGWGLSMMGFRWLAKTGSGDMTLQAVVAGNAIAALACLGWAFASGPTTISEAGAGSWAWLVYIGVFQIALAYLLVTKAVRELEALEVTLLLLLEPVLNPLWSLLVHGETPGRLALVGAGILLAANLLHSLRAPMRRK
jgi:drug/metabolite transporter (DMT)-like permease